jgi:hypothetical protein
MRMFCSVAVAVRFALGCLVVGVVVGLYLGVRVLPGVTLGDGRTGSPGVEQCSPVPTPVYGKEMPERSRASGLPGPSGC